MALHAIGLWARTLDFMFFNPGFCPQKSPVCSCAPCREETNRVQLTATASPYLVSQSGCPPFTLAKRATHPANTVSTAFPNAGSKNHFLHQRPGGFNCRDGILINLAKVPKLLSPPQPALIDCDVSNNHRPGQGVGRKSFCFSAKTNKQ